MFVFFSFLLFGKQVSLYRQLYRFIHARLFNKVSVSVFLIECEQCRFAAMPEQLTSHGFGISSSVAIFLLLSTICCMLSLTSPSARSGDAKQHAQNSTHEQMIWVSNYVPNLAMICVMIFGITAMAILIFKTDDFTTDHHSVNRHNLHRKLSLWGITAFFIGSCIFDMNTSSWKFPAEKSGRIATMWMLLSIIHSRWYFIFFAWHLLAARQLFVGL